MRFDVESWRKLYVAESAEHRLLPIFARGLRDYLLRLAGEDGTILAKSGAPKSDLHILLGARSQAEKTMINAAFDDLIRVGYLTHDHDRLWITKFSEAQRARTPGARRQSTYRKNHPNGKQSSARSTSDTTNVSDSDVTGDVTGDVTNDASGDAQVTSQIDETRRDEKDPPTPEPVKTRPPDPMRDSFTGNPDEEAAVVRVFERWKVIFRRSGAVLDIGWNSSERQILRSRIRANGEADCMLALEAAPEDGWVSGRSDDKGDPHESIRYIFGNDDAFSRILRAAKGRAKPGKTVQQRMAEAKAR